MRNRVTGSKKVCILEILYNMVEPLDLFIDQLPPEFEESQDAPILNSEQDELPPDMEASNMGMPIQHSFLLAPMIGIQPLNEMEEHDPEVPGQENNELIVALLWRFGLVVRFSPFTKR